MSINNCSKDIVVIFIDSIYESDHFESFKSKIKNIDNHHEYGLKVW